MRFLIPALLLGVCAAAAQDVATQDVAPVYVTLEQASSRSGRDMTPAYEGRAITIRGQVSAAPVWALGTYYLPIRDLSDHGLLIRGDRDRFADLVPGDWIECSGSIQSVAAMPLLAPSSLRKLRHDNPAEPKDLSISDLTSFRYLGLLVRTTGTVTGAVGENLGGRSLEVSDHGNTVSVFLPAAAGNPPGELRRVRVGDRVRLTGVATQYSLEPPHDSGYQLLMAGPEEVEVIPGGSMFPPLMVGGALGAIALVLGLWWFREKRLGINRRLMRAFHALSEDIISAGSPGEIAEKLVTVLPTVTQATGVRLYLYSRRSKALERVATRNEPDPMAVPIDSPPDGLAGGAVVCFRNRTLLNVPDVRRSPFVSVDRRNLPRSAMFLPLLSQNDVLGVLEVGNARRLGYFSLEEQAAAQHLANQVAASLKLQEQQTIREQLFRSEKLAATGQLISGVANELRAPLESILHLAASLAAYGRNPIPERELRMLAGESQRASEIVSRLVSFARPEDAAARPVDVNALIASLMQFRDPEWRTLTLRVQNRLATQPALVMGAQGQMEQVFLNLLVHAEQYASESNAKTIGVSSSLIARRVMIEIGYSIPLNEQGAEIDPFSEGRSPDGALGLGVCQGIIQSHGGEIRFRSGPGSDGVRMARFEIDLPVARESEQGDAGGDAAHPGAARAHQPATPLTMLLVDPDLGSQRQLLAQLSGRGHRVVPAPMEEAADLAQRVRFDAVFWAVRPSLPGASDYQERIRRHVTLFVLVSDVYDAELAGSLESSGSFLLTRPVRDTDLDRVLRQMVARGPNAASSTSAGRSRP
jgi:signal transduction histidine kinase